MECKTQAGVVPLHGPGCLAHLWQGIDPRQGRHNHAKGEEPVKDTFARGHETGVLAAAALAVIGAAVAMLTLPGSERPR